MSNFDDDDQSIEKSLPASREGSRGIWGCILLRRTQQIRWEEPQTPSPHPSLLRSNYSNMGIDLKAGGRRVGHKSSTKVIKTQNPYTRLLIKLYKFLARRTDSKFCSTVLKRLHQSKTNAPPIGLARLAKYMKNKDGKIAVIVAKVTDDVRMLECPKMSVCALGFTESARKRILSAGGECITFDQLALRAGAQRHGLLVIQEEIRP